LDRQIRSIFLINFHSKRLRDRPKTCSFWKLNPLISLSFARNVLGSFWTQQTVEKLGPGSRIIESLRNMTPQDRHPLPKNESQAWRGRRMRDAWRDLCAAQATSRRRCAKFSRSLKTVRSFFLRDLRGNSQYLY